MSFSIISLNFTIRNISSSSSKNIYFFHENLPLNLFFPLDPLRHLPYNKSNLIEIKYNLLKG